MRPYKGIRQLWKRLWNDCVWLANLLPISEWTVAMNKSRSHCTMGKSSRTQNRIPKAIQIQIRICWYFYMSRLIGVLLSASNRYVSVYRLFVIDSPWTLKSARARETKTVVIWCFKWIWSSSFFFFLSLLSLFVATWSAKRLADEKNDLSIIHYCIDCQSRMNWAIVFSISHGIWLCSIRANHLLARYLILM